MLNSKTQQPRSGFTIVELVVVIVVIAILATLVAVSYNGMQERALDAVTETDIANFEKDIHLHGFKGNGLPASLAELQSSEFAGVEKMSWGSSSATRGDYGVATYGDGSGYTYGQLYYWSYRNNHWMEFRVSAHSPGEDWQIRRSDGYLVDPVTGQRPCRAEHLGQCSATIIL